MTTYGYTRVSSIGQVDGTSLADQERVIRGCSLMRGDESVVIFADPDVSGTIPLRERPSGSQLMAAVKRGDVVIVPKMDRMFRSAADALTTAKEFQDRGVDLILCDMGLDPVTQSGSSKMFFGMLALVAEFERDRLCERTNAGRKCKKAAGGHIGGLAPYGFRVEGTGKDAVLIEYMPEQSIILKIKAMSQIGSGPTEITRALDRASIRNRLGKPFAKTQVVRILRAA